MKSDPDPENIEDDEEIDENDPLWKATLQIAKGDRKKALKLLEDPDALMQFPEVIKMMEESESADADTAAVESVLAEAAVDDWDQQLDGANSKDVEAKPKASSVEPADTEDAEQEYESTPGKGAVEEEDVAEVDSDPRAHMNIVFIGHVDAGKSTLSGSILYLMGKVDARTIERFEREAKQRNRESWFLAFIMVSRRPW